MIRSAGKKFFFICIRAKIDQGVENEKRSKQHLFNKDEILKNIRKECSENLIARGLLQDEKDIFLISNPFPAKYQFGDLTQAILDVLPQRQKESLILTIDNGLSLSEETLKRKVEVLKKRIKYVATASALAASVPFPGTAIVADIALITREINFYKSQLGLPEEGSNSRFSMLSINTQNEVKTLTASFSNALQMGKLAAAYSAEGVVEEFVRIIPFIGLTIAGPLSFGATYYFLKSWLEDMEKLAIKVLRET
ncbi:interferon-inducible GTPase 5-like [Stylophora pistillata]|nr:interferon-inducible GTPase 5-like [Stylophora pistillata]